jgi:predicted ribonuclease YlaK
MPANGARRHARPHPLTHQSQVAQLHARAHLHQQVLIIDEAQNLTPKQKKTLITRAGPGTKVVCLGNISQIDTPSCLRAVPA